MAPDDDEEKFGKNITFSPPPQQQQRQQKQPQQHRPGSIQHVGGAGDSGPRGPAGGPGDPEWEKWAEKMSGVWRKKNPTAVGPFISVRDQLAADWLRDRNPSAPQSPQHQQQQQLQQKQKQPLSQKLNQLAQNKNHMQMQITKIPSIGLKFGR